MLTGWKMEHLVPLFSCLFFFGFRRYISISSPSTNWQNQGRSCEPMHHPAASRYCAEHHSSTRLHSSGCLSSMGALAPLPDPVAEQWTSASTSLQTVWQLPGIRGPGSSSCMFCGLYCQHHNSWEVLSSLEVVQWPQTVGITCSELW